MVDQITDDMFTDGSNILLPTNSLSWLNKYAPKDFTECPLKADEKKQMSQWLEYLIKKPTESSTNYDTSKSNKKKR